MTWASAYYTITAIALLLTPIILAAWAYENGPELVRRHRRRARLHRQEARWRETTNRSPSLYGTVQHPRTDTTPPRALARIDHLVAAGTAQQDNDKRRRAVAEGMMQT